MHVSNYNNINRLRSFRSRSWNLQVVASSDTKTTNDNQSDTYQYKNILFNSDLNALYDLFHCHKLQIVNKSYPLLLKTAMQKVCDNLKESAVTHSWSKLFKQKYNEQNSNSEVRNTSTLFSWSQPDGAYKGTATPNSHTSLEHGTDTYNTFKMKGECEYANDIRIDTEGRGHLSLPKSITNVGNLNNETMTVKIGSKSPSDSQKEEHQTGHQTSNTKQDDLPSIPFVIETCLWDVVYHWWLSSAHHEHGLTANYDNKEDNSVSAASSLNTRTANSITATTVQDDDDNTSHVLMNGLMHHNNTNSLIHASHFNSSVILTPAMLKQLIALTYNSTSRMKAIATQHVSHLINIIINLFFSFRYTYETLRNTKVASPWVEQSQDDEDSSLSCSEQTSLKSSSESLELTPCVSSSSESLTTDMHASRVLRNSSLQDNSLMYSSEPDDWHLSPNSKHFSFLKSAFLQDEQIDDINKSCSAWSEEALCITKETLLALLLFVIQSLNNSYNGSATTPSFHYLNASPVTNQNVCNGNVANGSHVPELISRHPEAMLPAVPTYRGLQSAFRVITGEHPIIILIAGAAGCGKSTLSCLLANRLGIGTLLSTDTVRHILRSVHTKNENALLYASTYETGQFVTDDQLLHHNRIDIQEFATGERATTGFANYDKINKRCFCTAEDIKCLLGYLRQSEMLYDRLEFLIERLLNNGESAIVEGVHLTAEFIKKIYTKFPLQCIPFLLYISQEETHVDRFANRSRNFTTDPSKNKYVQHLRSIRAIQDYLKGTCGGSWSGGTVVLVNNVSISGAVRLMHSTIVKFLGDRDAIKSHCT